MSTAADHPFLGALPAHAREQLAGCGEQLTVPAGTLLFRTGEPADAFHLIVAGRVSLEVPPPAGPPLIVETVDAGSAVGWSWLVPPHRCQFDARAVTDVTTVRIAAPCAHRAMAADPAVAAALLLQLVELVADRLRHARIQLLDLYGHDRGQRAERAQVRGQGWTSDRDA